MTDDSSPPSNDLPDEDWDLDDDELSLGEAIKPSPIGFSKKNTEITGTTFPLEPAPEPAPPEEPAPTPEIKPASPEEPAEEPPAQSKSPEPTSPTSSEETKPSSSTSLIEKISLLAVLGCLAALLVWLITTFQSEAPEGELIEFTTDFPVEGKKITIAEVDTWWRNPIRTGEKTDVGVVVDANLIPCASITLEGGGTTMLQASFRDGENKLIGDTINLSVKDGIFTKNNSNVITFHATDGFDNATDINPYVNENIDPWSLVIVEEEDPNESIVKARISGKRVEN